MKRCGLVLLSEVILIVKMWCSVTLRGDIKCARVKVINVSVHQANSATYPNTIDL